MQAAPECLVVTVHTRRQLDAALDGAVDLLMAAATAERTGISVTRRAHGRFEVCLDSDVPPGTTTERWCVLDEPR